MYDLFLKSLFEILVFIKRRFGRFGINSRVNRIRFGVAKGFLRRGGLGTFGILKRTTLETMALHALDLKGLVIYDVGANFGAFALFFSRSAGPGGRVFTFEPVETNCKLIRENLALNQISNVTLYSTALGAADGELEMILDPEDTSMASFEEGRKRDLIRLPHAKSVKVPVRALDSLLPQQGWPPPDFIKIDVEGFEFEVLQGMREILRSRHPRLWIELHHTGTLPFPAHGGRILEFLGGFGYAFRSVEKNKPVLKDNLDETLSEHLDCVFQTP